MTKESREEDSGLHDIRGLAASTKARMSARRSTQNPVMTDEDLIASSSAGWKAVALPEPAKMVSLPELTELPSAKEIKAKDKAAQKAKAAEDKVTAKAAVVAPVATTAPASTATAIDAPAPAASVTPIGSRIAAKQQGGNKSKTIALVGVGVAAAAGVAIFFAMSNSKSDSAKNTQVAAGAPAPREEYKPTAKMLPPPPAPTATAIDTAAAGSGAAAEPPPVAQIATSEEPAKAAPTKAAAKGADKPHKVEIRDTSMTDNATKVEKTKAPVKDEKAGEKKDPDAGDPSFDQLLKEAGVSDKQAAKKVALTKKSLDGSDIKSGMGAVAGKAQGCYAGTQGQANVRLTVAPSGQVTKVSVTGAFAGTPVASCVEAAVKGASFPAWDGGPQSFGYTYLLSE